MTERAKGKIIDFESYRVEKDYDEKNFFAEERNKDDTKK